MERKPLAKAGCLIAHSVRCHEDTWARIAEAGRRRGFDEFLVFTRKLLEYALDDVEQQDRLEASVGMPRQGLRGSQRVRRV